MTPQTVDENFKSRDHIPLRIEKARRGKTYKLKKKKKSTLDKLNMNIKFKFVRVMSWEKLEAKFILISKLVLMYFILIFFQLSMT